MRPVVAPLVLTVLAPAVLVAAPASAAGPLTVRSATASGSPVITAGKAVKVPIRVRVTGTRVTDVDATLRHPNGKGFALVSDLKRVSGSAGDGVWQGTALLDKADAGGRYTLEVAATDGTSAEPYYDFVIYRKKNAVTVRRAVKLTLKLPKQAVKGKRVQARGTVKGLNAKGGFAGLKGRTVHVWFRPKGGGKAVRLGTVRTKAGGTFVFAIKTSRDGSVSARFPGNAQWQKRATGWKALDVR
ncbi:hypothetical protein LO762_15930 [Actinocorallia sp. API 0066]|uniref:hypothetical protein n=1 Tax=Actinocorallia sp. API 0066 TaxID=2896846 RepID=UPI001E50A8FB|nr:hypothetical protein [Actinocorallia sp. API 0066]MCD0450667.1 hypothetical protein [Actinocorallia sp. API 0066]